MEGLAAIGGLVALAAGFAFFGMRAVKKAEQVKTNDQLDALEEEDEAITEFNSVGDAGDDDAVLRDIQRRS